MHQILVMTAALSLAIPAAAAADTLETRSIAVAHSDLNLATPHGREQLAQRIESAARRVCGYDSRANKWVIENGKARVCYKQAKAAALVRFAAVVERRAIGG